MRKKSIDNMETIDDIRYRILDRIDDKYNKHPGTFVWDMISPTSFELAFIYEQVLNVENLLDVDKLEGSLLDIRVKDIANISRKPATFATGYVTITGNNKTNIPKGTLVAAGDEVFEIIQDATIFDGEAIVQIQAMQPGSRGNVMAGSIDTFPVTIPGLVTVTNKEDLSNGYDTESDESLRERYYTQLRLPATSGNKYHYILWSKEVVGVGDVFVEPLWNGNGTVRVVIVDSNMNQPSEELIANVSNKIEAERPIGATVTVVGAKEKDIIIDVAVRMYDGYTIETIRSNFQTALEEYRKSVGFDTEYISIGKIGSILMQKVEGVRDYEELKINGDYKNIPLSPDEIPIFKISDIREVI